MQKIKMFILSLAVALSTVGATALVPVYASTASDDACAGLQQIDPSKKCDSTADTGLNGIIKAVVNILSYVIGAAAVIMIIISGLKYITASGDSNSISSAKNTLIYALVGLVIAVLAQVLVKVVLGSASNAVK